MKTKLLRKAKKKVKLYYMEGSFTLYYEDYIYGTSDRRKIIERDYRELILKNARKIFGTKRVNNKHKKAYKKYITSLNKHRIR